MRLRLVLVIWMAVVLPASAQVAVRVRWPLIDFLVRADSSHTFELIASPNLRSRAGIDNLESLDFAPLEALMWSNFMLAAVDSLTKLENDRRGVIPVRLRGSHSPLSLALRIQKVHGASSRFTLMLTDSTYKQGWQADASVADVDTLLHAMRAVALFVLQPEDSSRALMGVDSCQKTSFESEADPDSAGVPPELLEVHGLEYPNDITHRDARVWVQFILDRTGHAEPESICILLSDGDAFTRAAKKALPQMQYRPARSGSRPVRVVVRQEFRFFKYRSQ